MLKILEKIRAVHVVLILALATIILLWIRTNQLQNNVVHLISTNDTLVTYINELNQRVYDLPSQQIDVNLINKLAKVDSSYNALKERLKSLDRSQNDLIAAINVSITARDSGSTTNIVNEYYVQEPESDETVKFRTFRYKDDLIEIHSSVSNKLTHIDHDYKIDLGNVYVDVFKAPGRTYETFLTFSNSKLNLSSQRVIVGVRPIPAFVISAGVGASVTYANKQLYAGPSLNLTAGIPLYTFYKHSK
jgi:hypothetical protein